MAGAFVQAASAEGLAASSVTTAAITTTTGNQVYIGTNTTGTDATTPITDSYSNTWVQVGHSAASSYAYVELWYCANLTGGSGHTFTYTTTGSDYDTIAVMEFSGMATSSPLDVGGNTYFAGPTNGSSLTTPSLTTLNAADVLIAVGGDDGSAVGTRSFNSPFTTPSGAVQSSNAGQPVAMGYYIISATGAHTATYNPGGINRSSAGIAAFKQGATAAPAFYPFKKYLQFPAWEEE